MVSWLGDKFKFDLDLKGLGEHSLWYFGALATAFYLVRKKTGRRL